MMPPTPNNGGSNNGESRLDRMEGMLDLIIRDHATFAEDHRRFAEDHSKAMERMDRLEGAQEEFRTDLKMLLTAQVVFQDELATFRKEDAQRREEEDQRHKDMDERIGVLIGIMDEHIRRNPLPPQ